MGLKPWPTAGDLRSAKWHGQETVPQLPADTLSQEIVPQPVTAPLRLLVVEIAQGTPEQFRWIGGNDLFAALAQIDFFHGGQLSGTPDDRTEGPPAQQIVDDPLALYAPTGCCGVVTIRLQKLDIIPLGQITQGELPNAVELRITN